MSYDSAGNLFNDSYSGQGQRTYDAENRIVAAQDIYSGWSYYTNDAGGNRVRRKIGNDETWQIYGIGGELVAEYAANASPSSPQKEYGYRSGQLLVTATNTTNDIQWLVTDQLGTPRMIFDKTGSLAGTKRHDYLPFGEELYAGIGSRSTALGYCASDSVRQKFTLKERDIETGLDYFKARYYSSAQGRFTSADAPFADQRQTDPSSWNSYAYVRNNPCNRTDPNGRCSPPAGLKAGQVGICIEAFIAAKTFKTFGAGNDRTFNGNDEKLTSKFRVDIIAERMKGNSKNLTVTQKTTAGFSYAVEPLTGVQVSPAVQGTANSKLNSTEGSSGAPSVSARDPDGALRSECLLPVMAQPASM